MLNSIHIIFKILRKYISIQMHYLSIFHLFLQQQQKNFRAKITFLFMLTKKQLHAEI